MGHTRPGSHREKMEEAQVQTCLKLQMEAARLSSSHKTERRVPGTRLPTDDRGRRELGRADRPSSACSDSSSLFSFS